MPDVNPVETATQTISQTLKSIPQPDLKQIEADRARTLSEATRRQGELDAQRISRYDREDKEVKPIQDREIALEKEVAALKPPELTADQVKWQPKPIVDSKDFQNFSYALIGIALIGGVASRGNWLGVSTLLNGAMDGYLKGNQTKADRAFKDYQTKLNEALEHDKRMQKEFEDVLRSKNLTINEMLREIQNIASEYGKEDMRAEATQRSIDGLWRQLEAYDRSITQVEEQSIRVGATVGMGLARMQQTMGGAAWNELDQYGLWVLDQTRLRGDETYMRELQSRYGGPAAAHALNELGRIISTSNAGKQPGDPGYTDPSTLTLAAMNKIVQTAAQRQATVRLQAVERLTGSITPIEGRVNDLVAELNGNGIKGVNQTFNAIAKQFGDAELGELQTLLKAMGTQYIEALTMPGSNAQLHATASEWAEGNFDPNQNLQWYLGVFKAMNFEIQTTTASLRRQVQETKDNFVGGGLTIAPPPPPPVGGGGPQIMPPSVAPPVPGATPAN